MIGPVRIRAAELLDDLRMRLPEQDRSAHRRGIAGLTAIVLAVGGAALGVGLSNTSAVAGPRANVADVPNTTMGPPLARTPNGPDSAWQPQQDFPSFPCTPIDVLIDAAGLPADKRTSVEADVGTALDAVAVATGRTFDVSVPRVEVASGQPPEQSIVISFVDERAELSPGAQASDVLAVGGTYTTGQTVRSGYVVLLMPGPPAGNVPGGRVTLLEHELGHALGIAEHSSDPVDVMYPELPADRAPGWGAGDLRALSAVGCR